MRPRTSHRCWGAPGTPLAQEVLTGADLVPLSDEEKDEGFACYDTNDFQIATKHS